MASERPHKSSDINQLLRENFAELQSRNPAFSLRAYARRLGLAPSALSGIMNSSRPLTRRTAERVLRGLMIDPERARCLLSGIPNRNNGSQRDYFELEADAFHLVSDWHYFAMLSALETKNPPCDAREFADRLGLPLPVARQALKRLMRLGLIIKKGKRLKATGKRLSSTVDVPSAAIRKAHLQGLELAQRSLLRDPVEKRDFSSSTLAIDPAKIPEAKRRLQAFRRRLASFLETGDRRAVYRIHMQLFPLVGESSERDANKGETL